MDHIMENKFLNKEAAQKKELREEDEEMLVSGFSKEEAQYYILESFVKEKHSLLAYIRALVIYSAQQRGLDQDSILSLYPDYLDTSIKQKLAKSEQDVINFKNRIITIVIPTLITIQIEKYQEQSGVLDSVLAQMICPIMKYFQYYIKLTTKSSNYAVPKDVSHLFEIVNWVCKVRGYKTVIKFFPHEVADMEPVVELLHFQCTDEWWISYVLILWLSIIVLVPFDIETIDSMKGGGSVILVKRIINISKAFINNSGKIREATTVLLAKLLTRPDVVKQGETEAILRFLAEEYIKCKDDGTQMFSVSGILQTLTEIFKAGHREDLLPRIDIVFEPILQSQITNKFMSKSTNLRKSRVKLAQRIGCIFLKPKVVSWRYQRGFRSLQQNLGGAQMEEVKEMQQVVQQLEEEDDELSEEQFGQLEFIIQYLLDSLKDEDSAVRWTAAKGLGRITGRLNKDFADQIVQQLHDLFDDNETESAWHGACLSLAELCRRGLLLPERIEEFIPILEKALIYDINKGTHSVGAHVRDSACYVVWSFARAYPPHIMKPYVHTLSNQLIVESLFDREVNCRRAASATFQECVGRQGNFPHGIEILTEADYFTLSNRVNAYLNVSTFVAQFPEYFPSMTQHLAFIKLKHWDAQIRELAAQSLAAIVSFNPEYIIDQILPQLIELCFSKLLHVRHGAVLGVAEILVGLSGNCQVNKRETLEKAFKQLSIKEIQLIADSDYRQKFLDKYNAISTRDYLGVVIPEGSAMRQQVKEIIGKVDKLGLSKGKGGEIMRGGICHLIKAMAMSGVQFQSNEERLYLFSQLQENFKHPNTEIQEEATKAFETYCQAYLSQTTIDDPVVQEIIKMFEPSIVDNNVSLTRGYNMAFGVMSRKLFELLTPQVFETLIKNCLPKGKESDDAETRKFAVRSVIQAIKTCGIANVDIAILQKSIETFYQCLNDYQIDRRGDVGSWVREEAMTALKEFIQLLYKDQGLVGLRQALQAAQPQSYERFIGSLMQQLCEKIDKVREVAGRALQEFFKNVVRPNLELINFSYREELLALFMQHDQERPQDRIESSAVGYLPWRNAEFVFSQIKPFFDSDTYSISIFKGLITSSGGLTESTLKASSNTLMEYLSQMGDNEEGVRRKKQFLHKIITIFETNLKDERVTVPLMKTIELLLTSEQLSDPNLNEELYQLHSLTVQECQKSKNIVKLTTSVGVFSGLLLINLDMTLKQKSIKSLLFLLYHAFPKVRKVTAEKLYTALLTMEDYTTVVPGGEESYDQVIEMLSETNWDGVQLKELAHGKEVIYSFFGLVPQKAIAQPKQGEDVEMIST